MRSTSSKHLNIKIPADLHVRLVDFERLRGIGSHREFIEKAIEQEFEGNFVRILAVDDSPSREHRVLIQMGECVHLWNGEEFVSYDEEQTGEILRSKGEG